MERETVRVLSRRAPTLVWHCPRCHEPCEFTCSEHFRANANGRVVDIWLIYRCSQCDTTRNLAVAERVTGRHLPAGLLEAAFGNDPVVARRLARDLSLIRRRGATVARGDDYRCVPPDQPDVGRDTDVEVVIEFPEPLLLRLDHVIAIALGESRSRLRRLIDSGAVTIGDRGRLGTLRLWATTTVIVRNGPGDGDR